MRGVNFTHPLLVQTMSNKISQSLQSKKDEKINESPNGETQNRFLQDIQLLSSLKDIFSNTVVTGNNSLFSDFCISTVIVPF